MYPPCSTVSIAVTFSSAHILHGVFHSLLFLQQNLKVLLRFFHVNCVRQWNGKKLTSIVQQNEMGGACCAYGEGRGVHSVLVGKPEGKRSLGRPRRRWEDNIKMDLQEVGGGCGDWMELA